MQILKSRSFSNVLCWFFYAVVILVVAFSIHHGEKIPTNWGVELFATPSEISRHFGMGDQGSYVNAALVLPKEGLQIFAGGYSMFPPGLSIVEMILMSLSPNVPLAFVILLCSLALWAIFMVCLCRATEDCFHMNHYIALIVPLCLLPIPFFWETYLWDAALMTESLSTPLFAIACLESWRIIVQPKYASIKKAVIIGLLFAIASYIRAQFELVFFMFVGASFFLLLITYFRLPKSDSQKKSLWHRYSMALLAAFVAYNVAVVPYKVIYKKASTIVVIEYIWEMVWKPESFYVNTPGQFFSGGGGHSICAIAPEKCAQFTTRKDKGEVIPFPEYKRAAMKTVFLHPFSLLYFKAPYFWKMWATDTTTLFRTYFNFILLSIPLLMIVLLGAAGDKHRWQRIGIYVLYFTAMVGGSAGFSLIAQVEPRYLMPIKLFLCISLLLGIAWAITAWRASKKRISSL